MKAQIEKEEVYSRTRNRSKALINKIFSIREGVEEGREGVEEGREGWGRRIYCARHLEDLFALIPSLSILVRTSPFDNVYLCILICLRGKV